MRVRIELFVICLVVRRLLAIALMVNTTILTSSAQEIVTNPGLKELAARHGIEFGFALSELNPYVISPQIDIAVRRDANIGSITAFWALPDFNIVLDDTYGGPVIDKGPILPSGPSSSSQGGPEQVVIGKYNFKAQEASIRYCVERNLKVHGHVLLWAQDIYNPPWVIQQVNLNASTAGPLIENHISTVAGHFKGKIAVWDVINEAYDTEGRLRDSAWSRAMGDSFIDLAFRTAAAADPQAKLVYNDFDLEVEDPRRFQAVLSKVRQMQATGVPIHGIGWQLHTNTGVVLKPTFALASRLREISALGLQNYVTELDIVVPNSRLNVNGKPSASDLELQKRAYRKLTEILVAAKVSSITTWGVADDKSWLGADKFPLLYDTEYRPKPAYDGVRRGLGDQSGSRTIRHHWTNTLVSTGGTQFQPRIDLFSPLRMPTTASPASIQWRLTNYAGDLYWIDSVTPAGCLQPMSKNPLVPIVLTTGTLRSPLQSWTLKRMHGDVFMILNSETRLGLAPNPNRTSLGSTTQTNNSLWVIE